MSSRKPGNIDVTTMSPREFREMVRRGEWTESNLKACHGYAQADVALVPKEFAFEFLQFCIRNPQPLPLLDVTDVGSPSPSRVASDADLRTDLSRYRVFINGELVDEPTNVNAYWRDDLVGFLTGCSVSIDWACEAANVPSRLIGVYSTNIPLVPAGPFRGFMAVTCRLVKGNQNLIRTIQISSRHPASHGAPVHVGDPSLIGIKDIYHPDLMSLPGPIARQDDDEIAVFWGCGLTLETAALELKPSLWIVDGLGSMFVTDKRCEELAVI